MRFTTMLASIAGAATLAGICTTAVLAQAPARPPKDVFKYTSPADIQAAMKPHNADTGQATFQIATYPDFTGVEVDRNKSGRVEIHDKWADFIVVLEGKGTFTIGGAVTGKVVNGDPAKGEWFANSKGGKVYDMAPGATFIVPAGIPHWMQVPAGGHLRYIAFKHPANS